MNRADTPEGVLRHGEGHFQGKVLLQIKPKLEELLVESLAGQSALSVADLRSRLSRAGRRDSFQAVYKALAKLGRVGVVVKSGRLYSLKSSWSLALLSLAEKIQRTQFGPAVSASALPKPGQSRSWHFRSLLKLDDYWGHLVLNLFHASESKIMFEWLPHPWFELLHLAKEDQFREALRRKKCKVNIIIGGDTFLDRECTKRWHKDIYRYSFSEGPFESQRSVYIDVIEDYILTLRIGSQASRKVDDYFESVSSYADLDISKFIRLMTQPARGSIRLENNEIKARGLRKKFLDYFG